MNAGAALLPVLQGRTPRAAARCPWCHEKPHGPPAPRPTPISVFDLRELGAPKETP
jgi:hypothetical protein